MWFMSVGQAEEYVRSAYSRHVIVNLDHAKQLQAIAQALGIEDVGLVRDAIATPAGRDIGELRVGDRITYRGQEYVVKHDSAGVALRMTAADPGVYGDHPDYREEWRT